MTEYPVDLGRANFKFDLDLLEHVYTEIPQAGGGEPLLFDHQRRSLFLGERAVFGYDGVSSCFWQSGGTFSGLECHGPNGLAYRFGDPNMDGAQAKEIFFRLANICEWKPQNSPPVTAVVDDGEPEGVFDPAKVFRLPRESTMSNLLPAGDWTKPDDFSIVHDGQMMTVRVHDSKNELFLNGQSWARLDEIKEIVFKRQEDRVEFVFPSGRWGLTIGNDRPGQAFETRVKTWARSHHWAISEAQPEAGRNQVILKVDLLRAILEGGQIRIRGQREVLFHHGQQCVRIDGEVFDQYANLTQMRGQMQGDKLTVRLWFNPKTLLILEATAPCDINTGRMPDFLRALVRGVAVPLEG